MDGRRSVRGERREERKGSDSGCARRGTSQFDLSARRLSLSLSLSLLRTRRDALSRVYISHGYKYPEENAKPSAIRLRPVYLSSCVCIALSRMIFYRQRYHAYPRILKLILSRSDFLVFLFFLYGV